jgi:hypothetical protein
MNEAIMSSQDEARRRAVEGSVAHVPEKWTPGIRKEHPPLKKQQGATVPFERNAR